MKEQLNDRSNEIWSNELKEDSKETMSFECYDV